MGQAKKSEMEEANKFSSERCTNLGCQVPFTELDIFKKTGYCGDCAARIELNWKKD